MQSRFDAAADQDRIVCTNAGHDPRAIHVPHLRESKRVPILARDTPVRELIRDTHIDREREGKGAVIGAIKVD